jgi:hypothetical protein
MPNKRVSLAWLLSWPGLGLLCSGWAGRALGRMSKSFLASRQWLQVFCLFI